MAKPIPPVGRERYKYPKPGVVASCPSCELWLTEPDVARGFCERCGEDFTADDDPCSCTRRRCSGEPGSLGGCIPCKQRPPGDPCLALANA